MLLSGGLDSATCLALAIEAGTEPYALTVDYGQKHAAELACAARIAATMGAVEHKVMRVDLAGVGDSALTGGQPVPKGGSVSRADPVPPTYVPARNTILFALALGYAEVVGASSIYLGVNSVDFSGYPDCRPEYIVALSALAPIATCARQNGRTLEVRAPLLYLPKAEIIRTGLSLGVDYSLTLSCYDPVQGYGCGECEACQIRAAGFKQAGVSDPAQEPGGVRRGFQVCP